MKINNVNIENQEFLKSNSSNVGEEKIISIFNSLDRNGDTLIDENDELSTSVIEELKSIVGEVLSLEAFKSKVDKVISWFEAYMAQPQAADCPEMSEGFEGPGELVRPEPKQEENYSYQIESPEQIVNMQQEAQEYLGKLTPEKADIYKELISKIHYDEAGNIDIEHADTIKAFLALKKLIKYQGEIPVLEHRIDETTPLLGDYYSEYVKLKNFISENPEVENSLSNMYRSIYGDSEANRSRFIIPLDQSEEANVIAERLLQEEMQKYNIDNPSNLFRYDDFRAGVTYTCDVDNEWNDWNMQITIREGGYGNESNFTPAAIVLLHELYHTKQTKPGEKENYNDEFVELGATINQMIMEDKIYKEINHIDLNQEVLYPDSKFKLPNGEFLNLGTIANTFREIMEENHFTTIEEALMSPKAQEFIMKYYR